VRIDAWHFSGRFLRLGVAGLLVAVGFSLGGCANGGRRVQPEVTDDHAEPSQGAREVVTLEDKDEEGRLERTMEGYNDPDGDFILHGKLTNYWPNGKKKSEENYVHGVRQGPRQAWYQDGQSWSYGEYIDGKSDGTWTTWYPDGRKAQEINFVDGGWHGLYTEWHDNGQKAVEREWVNGKIQGIVTVWDENGNIISQVEYKDSVPQP